MSRSESLEALRRANPRARPGFKQSVAAARTATRSLALSTPAVPATRRRPFVGVSIAGASIAIAAGVAVVLTLGPHGRGVDNAGAAVRKAAALSAASAERSGTALVRITKAGEPWAGSTIRWHDRDLSVSDEGGRRPGLLVVDNMLYGVDPSDGGWVELGPTESVDPDSGTTPAEYLEAVREDVGGTTLRRIVGGMTGLTTTRLDNGFRVYRGTAPAGLVARETGFKDGQAIRVLPFGFVAHGEAADPAAPLHVAVTVDGGGIVRQLLVTWGTGGSAWAYSVAYSDLGATAPPEVPKNVRPFDRKVPPGR